MIEVIFLMGLCPEIADKIDWINHRLNKHGEKAENFVLGIPEHGNHYFLFLHPLSFPLFG